MDYFSDLFEQRATKCRVNRWGKTGPMKSHGRQVQVLLQIILPTVSSRVPRCVARHCARNVRGVAWELEFSRVV